MIKKAILDIGCKGPGYKKSRKAMDIDDHYGLDYDSLVPQDISEYTFDRSKRRLKRNGRYC